MLNELLNLIELNNINIYFLLIIVLFIRVCVGVACCKIAYDNKWCVTYWLIASLIFGSLAFFVALVLDSILKNKNT